MTDTSLSKDIDIKRQSKDSIISYVNTPVSIPKRLSVVRLEKLISSSPSLKNKKFNYEKNVVSPTTPINKQTTDRRLSRLENRMDTCDKRLKKVEETHKNKCYII